MTDTNTPTTSDEYKAACDAVWERIEKLEQRRSVTESVASLILSDIVEALDRHETVTAESWPIPGARKNLAHLAAICDELARERARYHELADQFCKLVKQRALRDAEAVAS